MPKPAKHKGHSKNPSYAASSLDKEIPLTNNEVTVKKKHHLKCQIM
jgi:hypothetical protein